MFSDAQTSFSEKYVKKINVCFISISIQKLSGTLVKNKINAWLEQSFEDYSRKGERQKLNVYINACEKLKICVLVFHVQSTKMTTTQKSIEL